MYLSFNEAAAFTDTPSVVDETTKYNLDSVVMQKESESKLSFEGFKTSDVKQSYWESSTTSTEMIVKEPAATLVDISDSVQVLVPIEITTPDNVCIAQDEEDDNHGVVEMMEHKAIPSSLEKRDIRTATESASLIQRQIKGDILDMELEQQEEIVMSESLIQQRGDVPHYQDPVPTITTTESNVVDRESLDTGIQEDGVFVDVGQRKTSVMFELDDTNENGLLENIETSPREPLSLEDAQILATDFVESLTEQAIKVSEEILSKKLEKEVNIDTAPKRVSET